MTMITFQSIYRSATLATLTGALLVSSAIAQADDVKVKLTGAEEVPAVTTTATGSGTISIAADKSVTGSVKTTGIEGMAAHVHLGAPGVSGPPIITLAKGAAGEWTVPAGSKLTDEQFASYKGGNLYVNVHSAEHKGGEIRAQLKPGK
jgi:CHRD domain